MMRRIDVRVGASAHASQSLSVLSYELETIVLPSSEKTTELLTLLCAFSFAALSSSVAARHADEASAARAEVMRSGVCARAPASHTLIVPTTRRTCC